MFAGIKEFDSVFTGKKKLEKDRWLEETTSKRSSCSALATSTVVL